MSDGSRKALRFGSVADEAIYHDFVDAAQKGFSVTPQERVMLRAELIDLDAVRAMAHEAGRTEALGLDHPFDLRGTIEQLADFADMMLSERDYDQPGHERLRYAEQAARRYLVALARTHNSPLCPNCSRVLRPVARPSCSPLNEDQYAAIRAGDWYCVSCPAFMGTAHQGKSGYAYFWNRDVCLAGNHDDARPQD